MKAKLMTQTRHLLTVAVATLFGVITPALAFALDTSYNHVDAYKAFSTHVSIVVTAEPHSCGTSADHYTIYASDTGFEHMSEALHAAFLAGREVSVRYSCVSSEARVTGVRVR